MWQRRYEKGIMSLGYLRWQNLIGKSNVEPNPYNHPVFMDKAVGEKSLYFCRSGDEHDNCKMLNYSLFIDNM